MSDQGKKDGGFGKTLLGTGGVPADVEAARRAAQAQQTPAPTPTPTAGIHDKTMSDGSARAPVLPPASPTAPRTDEALIGAELGGYRIIRKLDEGGMGVVFEAEHPQIGKRAALKVLKPEHCQNEATVERFYQEARAVNSIGHENIVDVFDFGRDDAGRVFFVMEYLEGESLAARIRRGPLSWREGQPLLEQVLAALAAAHAADIVHRDLKPENIFLRRSSDGTVSVRLLDFGIAKFIDLESVQDRLTRTGSMIGTPQYMSPEQINGSAAIDGRADIYSLGVIVFEMFTGRRPFDGETLGAVIKAHLLSPPPDLLCQPQLGVPGTLNDMVKRMLAKKVSDRYSSVGAVISDLRDVAANRAPTHASTLDQTNPLLDDAPIPAPPAASGSRAWLGVALGVLMLGLIAGGVWLFALRDGGDSGDEGGATAAGGGATVDGGAAPDTPPDRPAVDTRAAREAAQAVLARSLKEAEPRLRVRTCDAYGAIRDRDAVDPLAALLASDPDAEVRGHAAQALGHIGDESALGPLATAVKSAREPLDVWIHEALARLGDKKSMRALEKATRSKELAVALKATFALADMARPGDRKAVGALTKLARREAELNDVTPFAGVQILGRLARLRHGKARETLYAALEETTEGLVLAAARELARLGDDTGREALQKIYDDTGSPNRLAAARALVSLGDYSGVDTLTEALGSDKPAARIEAARGLGEVGETESIPALLELARGSDKAVALTAATAVLKIVGLSVRVLAQASVNWTKSALASDDWTERAAGARTLGDIPEAESLPLLAQAIADPEPTVRREAARSAGKIKSKAAAQKIAQAVVSEKNAGVKETQVKALAAMKQNESAGVLETIATETGRIGVLASGALIALGKTEAIKRLDEAIADRRTEIRVAAIDSASIANDPVVVGTVNTALEDRVFEVRLSAAEVLAEYGAAKAPAIAVLREALANKKPDLVSRAQAALLRIGEKVDVGPEQMLASDNPDTRMAALAAIAALEWSAAEPLLRRALADVSGAIRARAVELLEGFEASSREGVTKLYRKLTAGADPLIRAKAQARLARMLEVDRVKQAAAANAASQKKAVEQLAKAASEVDGARARLEPALAALAELSAELGRRTAKPPEDDAALDRVEKLTRQLAGALKTAKEVRKSLRDAVSRAKLVGAGVEGDEAAAIVAKLDKVEVEVGEQVAAALRSASTAVDRAEKYAVEETADPTLYLTSAKTAIATGQLGAARRDLRKAQELFKQRGGTPADLWFAYGELYYKLGRSAKTPADKKKHLERAKSSYERFVQSGRGFQVARAKESIRKITAELAKE